MASSVDIRVSQGHLAGQLEACTPKEAFQGLRQL